MKLSLRDSIIAFRRLAGRLAADIVGNTLAIVAAAIIPLAALVGSGIDMSRAYMAQARLQMACDAAALAGRRAMTTGAVDQTVRDEALKFFRFNFETGETGKTPTFKVASFTPTVNDGTNSAVVVAASTTVPTTLMSMFGYTNVPISVTCDARQDFVNTDIVLVLDTTGSMAQKAVSTDTQTKIEGLRSAVLALYDELAPAQTQLEAVGLRLRYGIVPYSVTVNVGGAIRAVDSNYLVSDWDYQTRVANFTTPNYVGTTGSPVANGALEIFNSGTGISSSNCTKYGNNTSFSGFTPTSPTSGGGPQPTSTWQYSWVSEWGWSGAPDNSGSTKSCRRQRYITTTTYAQSGYKFTNWTYKPATYNVSNFKTGSTITLATNTAGIMPGQGPYTTQEMAALGSGFSTSSYTWKGCIEERNTDNSIDSTSTAVTSAAHDLDIDEIPNSNETRWRPHWPDVVYTRNSTSDADATPDASAGTAMTSTGSNYWACPTAARRLQAWSKADLTTYVNSLNANGYTYHDIGMIWGARFISSNGIFAGDNPTTYKNMPVAKYIIYMTDGQLDTEPAGYTAYGVEYLDQRVSGDYTTTGDLDGRHRKRSSLACEAAKSAGANVWVIVFATGMTTELTNCASKPSQAKVSANSAALIQDFAKIGKEIGSLRLTK